MTTKTSPKAQAKSEAEEYDEAMDLLENFDPSQLQDASDLRHIAEAEDAIGAAEDRLIESVRVARANGRTWGQIGIALNTSRQNAFGRFGHRI